MGGLHGLLGVFVISSCLLFSHGQRTVCTQEAMADIVFLVDGSASIGLTNFQQVRQFLADVVSTLDIGPDRVRVGMVQFSDTARTEFTLDRFTTKEEILNYIKTLPYKTGGTNTGLGLQFMLENLFVENAGSRANQRVAQIAVVITDGDSQDEVETHAQNLKQKGIKLYAIGIKDADVKMLNKIASEPYHQYVFSVSDFTALLGISQNIIHELCTTVEEEGKAWQECREITSADIVFLVDSSDNTEGAQFDEIRAFLSGFIDTIDTQPNKVRVGLAQFSNIQYQEFLLGDYISKDDLLEKLSNIVHRKGGARTGAALDFVRNKYFSQARQNIPQIAIVITNGVSADSVSGPAQELRKQGVLVFVIKTGVRDDIRLHAIASSPQEEFLVGMDQNRPRLIENIRRKVCIAVEDQSQALSLKYSDIFFLVDSSASKTESQQIRTFLIRLVNQLIVGMDANRIGLAQFSESVDVEFLFSTNKTKGEIISSIRNLRLRPKGMRSTGNAIEYARKNFFHQSAGSRIAQGFKQVLLVATVGKSSDSVFTPSRRIKSEGVNVISVGLGQAEMDELQDIASPNQSYKIPPQNIQQVQLRVKTAVESQEPLRYFEECKSASIADIVFIVDISGRTGLKNFQLVRNFLSHTISGLDVGADKVRIAIVYYSDVPRADVYLNNNWNKKQILQYIKSLSHRRGRTYTGAALAYAKDHVFTKERGSRSDSHVPQIAVVVTDERSADDISAPAAKLRRSGVNVFAVGIKNAKEEELKQIASYPSRKFVFNIESFIKLDALSQVVTSSLCGDIAYSYVPPMKKNTLYQGCKDTGEADIYFLLDESGSIDVNEFYIDIKNFLIEFLRMFDIGPDKVRIGLVKFADYPTTVFHLHSYDSKVGIEKAIKDMIMVGGGTRTDLGLEAMIPLFKQASQTRKEKVRKLLIIITDGMTQAGSGPVEKPAEELRSQNVTIYSVGVKGANEAELLKISGSPDRTFYTKAFDGLLKIKDEILKEICSFDACTDFAADVVVLMDGGEAVDEADFTKTKALMQQAANKLNLVEDRVRLAVVQYSTDTQIAVGLNDFRDKEGIFSSLENMRQLGGKTYTGKALRSISEVFEESSRERPNTLQVLIVFTHGLSRDDVEKPAKDLRDKNVNIYAIGFEQGSRYLLETISGSREGAYLEENSVSIQRIFGEVLFKICNTECKTTELLDVIFLVDGSGDVDKESFQMFKRFMHSIVKRAAVGEKKVRFGLNVYSDQAESAFTLNKYFTKTEVMNAVSQIQTVGGSRNTAMALKQTLSHFHTDHGGRRPKHIPQVLCLLTDGPVEDAAELAEWRSLLRASEVNMFAIGVAEAIMTELRSITGNEQRTYYVNSYEEFRMLYKPVIQQLCNLTKPVCEKEVADLVILIDGSESISEVNWGVVKSTTINLIKQLDIAPNLWQVAVAQFSHEVRDHFYLNTYTNVAEVEQAIHKISQIKQGTNTWAALRKIDDYFTQERGSRIKDGVSQNLLLVTDGKANDEKDFTALAQLRAKNVQIYAIGIGNDVDPTELKTFTDSDERVFIETFDTLQLKTTTIKLLNQICVPIFLPEKRGCTIDIGIGFDVSRRASRQILLGPYAGLPVDAAIQHLSVIEDICCTKKDRIEKKFGFHLVSGNDGSTLDTFDFEPYDAAVVKKVLSIQPKQPLAFNALLLNAFEQKFKASGAGVKVLVLFTDGLDDTMEHLKESSESLHKSGVNALLIVSLSGHEDRHQQLEFGRGFRYLKPLSFDMLNVGSALQEEITAVATRVCCKISCSCIGSLGPPGPLGINGEKGFPGQKGHAGYPGEQGIPGVRGLPGLNGTKGYRGCPGKRGIKGSIGYMGSKGEDGEIGLDGVDGEQGKTGTPGAGGLKGDPGQPGVKGLRGNPGLTGEHGVRGDLGDPGANNNVPGPKGERGYPGPPGDQGPDGTSGLPGERGGQGFPGRKGIPGPPGLPSSQEGEPGLIGPAGHPGERGTPGASGPKGDKGDQGSSGVQGPYGAPGDKGARGNPGRQGYRGQPGDVGIKGDAGPEGFKGPPGYNGADGLGTQGPKGHKGTIGFPGYAGLLGEDGTKGSRGGKGPKGQKGYPGNRGSPGLPGSPAEPGIPGHQGPKGLAGPSPKTECELVNYVRSHCACCAGHTKCPLYPTELVVALDMSSDVTSEVFERIRSTAVSLLEDIDIAETNCPAGARVTIISYNSETKFLVRFSDSYHKKQLLESVRGIPLQRSRNQRNIGRSMRYVTENVFKRVRDGKLVRKVAIFLTNGPSQDASAINTAILELKAADIHLGVIAFRDAPNIRTAIQADETRSFMIFEPEQARRIKDCIICFDRCNPDQTCGIILKPVPEQVDVDLMVMMDASWDLQASEYSHVKEFLMSLLDVVDVSSQPTREDGRARIGIYQHSSNYRYFFNEVFGLNSYTDRAVMKRYIYEGMEQVGGFSRLNYALEWMVNNALLKAGAPRKKRMVLNVLSEETARFVTPGDLGYISMLCQCNDVIMVTLTVGHKFSWTQVEGLTTFPTDQHHVHLGQLSRSSLKYAQKFLRTYLRMLTRDFFPKPSSLNYECNTFVPRSNPDSTDLPPIAPTKVFVEPTRQPGEDLEPYTDYSDTYIKEAYTEIYREVSPVYFESFTENYSYDELNLRADQEETLEEHSKPNSDAPGQSKTTDMNNNKEDKGQSGIKAQCLLDQDVGTVCSDYQSRWYYDQKTLACKHFWYGGCDGNKNNFLSESECFETCVNSESEILLSDEATKHNDVCQLAQDVGNCYNFMLRWYYDATQKRCAVFWYGGCEGNGNRFKTQQECEAQCLNKLSN